MSSKAKVKIEGPPGSSMKRPTTPKTRSSAKGQMGKTSRGKAEPDVRVILPSRKNKQSSTDVGQYPISPK